MKNKQIVASLKEIADILDLRGMHKEASDITNIMIKTSGIPAELPMNYGIKPALPMQMPIPGNPLLPTGSGIVTTNANEQEYAMIDAAQKFMDKNKNIINQALTMQFPLQHPVLSKLIREVGNQKLSLYIIKKVSELKKQQ